MQTMTLIPATFATAQHTPVDGQVPQHIITPDALPALNAEAREVSAENVDRMTSALQRLQRHTVDAIVPTPALAATVLTHDNLAPADRLHLTARDQQGHTFALHVLDGAHEQLAQKLDIPRRFYDRMLSDHPDVLQFALNALFQREPSAFMLRMLKSEMTPDMATRAGRAGAKFSVRAVVSDKFRPLDHAGLMDSLIDAAREHTLMLNHWHLDDQRFTARFNGPERTIAEIREAHGFKAEGDNYHRVVDGKDMAWVNEVLSFGVEVNNSETGHGSLSVKQVSRVLRCLNAYVRDEVQRTVHVGRKQKTDDNTLIVSAATMRLEAAAQFARVRDQFVAAISAPKQKQLADAFATAMGHTLDLPPEVPALQFIDAVGASFSLSDRERELLQDEYVSELRVTGTATPSAFNVAQAMTATAQRVETFTRRQEVEAIGWRIIEDPTATLVKAAQDAVKATAK